MDSATLAAHEEATRVKTVNKIYFGGQEIDTWYFSPYPAEAQATDLHICEFCLSFFLKASELQTHALRCTARHPPGNEIYRDGQSVKLESMQCSAGCFVSDAVAAAMAVSVIDFAALVAAAAVAAGAAVPGGIYYC